MALSSPNAALHAEEPVLSAYAIAFDSRANPAKGVGSLAFLAGFNLVAGNAKVGGLSSLEFTDDGTSLLALSDRGRWLRLPLEHDADGRLVGLGAVTLESLRDIAGAPLQGGFADAEGLTRRADGALVVSFEGVDRIDVYPAGLDGPAKGLVPRGALRDLVRNAGLESIVGLPDGRLLALVEEPTAPGLHAGFLIGTDGAIADLAYRTLPDFKPTDLALLPGGDVLVLERRASLVFGFAARLVRVPAATIAAGATLEGRELGAITPPLAVDNFEGLAVRADAGGAALIYIVSDDNFSPLQRTLLLQFRLSE